MLAQQPMSLCLNTAGPSAPDSNRACRSRSAQLPPQLSTAVTHLNALMQQAERSGSKLHIAVEGNIGAGKSTLLSLLSKYLQIAVVPEPVESWEPLLTHYYEALSRHVEGVIGCDDVAAHSTLLQLQVLLSFLTQDLPLQCLTERSVWAGLQVFARCTAKRFGFKEVYPQLLKDIAELTGASSRIPDAIVYLFTSPESCYARARARARPAEDTMQMQLLHDLEQCYAEALAGCPPDRVWVLNGDDEPTAVLGQLINTLTQIFSDQLAGWPSPLMCTAGPAAGTPRQSEGRSSVQHAPSGAQPVAAQPQDGLGAALAQLAPVPVHPLSAAGPVQPPGSTTTAASGSCSLFVSQPPPYLPPKYLPLLAQLFSNMQGPERSTPTPLPSAAPASSQALLPQLSFPSSSHAPPGFSKTSGLSILASHLSQPTPQPGCAAPPLPTRPQMVAHSPSNTVVPPPQDGPPPLCVTGSLAATSNAAGPGPPGKAQGPALRRLPPSLSHASLALSQFRVLSLPPAAPQHTQCRVEEVEAAASPAAPSLSTPADHPPHHLSGKRPRSSLTFVDLCSSSSSEAGPLQPTPTTAPSAPGTPANLTPLEIDDIACTVCGRKDGEECLLLCDSCNAACHTQCCTPPYKSVPEGTYHCPDCKGEGPVSDIMNDEPVLALLFGRPWRQLMQPPDSGIEALAREAKRVTRRAAGYVVVDGELWKVPSGRHFPRRVPQQHERLSLIHNYHHNNGHFGAAKLIKLMGSRFYWHNMCQDIKGVVRACDACQRHSTPPRVSPGLQITPPPPHPMYSSAIDAMGPFKVTQAGNKYILVWMDHFTCWAVASARRSLNSQETARFFLECVVQVLGCPVRLLCDNARDFDGDFKELCNTLGVKQRRSASRMPEQNGALERLNRTLGTSIAKTVHDHPATWDSALQSAVHAYNVTPHSTTGFSPYRLMFGREPILPGQFGQLTPTPQIPTDSESEKNPGPPFPSPLPPPFDILPIQPCPPDSSTAFGVGPLPSGPGTPHPALAPSQHLAGGYDQKLRDASEAITNSWRAQQRQQRQVQRKWQQTAPPIPTDSLVLLKMNKKGKGAPVWEGPYLLVEWTAQHSEAVLEEGSASHRRWTVHPSRIRQYHTPAP